MRNITKRLEKKNVSDILSLTPLQSRMLYHYLKNRKDKTKTSWTDYLKGIEDIVGLLINTLPMRVKTEPGEKCRRLLQQVNHQYIDISNNEMTEYLNNREPYWKTRKNYAIYSTNCPIKQLGDYQHLKSRTYHFYGGATNWEQRLGHLTVENRKEDLPAYMIPYYFMRLPKIPLHPSGKIDKRSLPRPDGKRKQSANYVAPGNDLEKQIVLIWQEVLEIEKAGIQDNFFDQGGTSMNIIQVGSRLRAITKREIPLVTFFNHTTIQEPAQHLEGEQKQKEMQKALQERELKKSRGTMKKTISKLRGRRMN